MLSTVLTGPGGEDVPVLDSAGEVVPGVTGDTGDRVLPQPYMLATQPTATPPPAGGRRGGNCDHLPLLTVQLLNPALKTQIIIFRVTSKHEKFYQFM